ncbi:hypothetical protein SprV_0100035300 [Sparganum proliferum]
MRAHFMENVSKALAVLKEQNIHLENIGASDIVDGNANLILGLIWTIMLHFQVHVHNFTTDWTDGLSICALLHRHRPDLLDFNTLLSESPLSRITTAFTVAASRLRIPVLVEPREFIACCCCRDERCVIAVIATWYQFLNQDRATKKSGDRLSAVLARALDVNRKLAAYLCRVARAKAWLKKNQEFLNRQTEILTSPRQRNVHAGADDSLRRLRQWTYFTLDGEIYEQVKGTPMGSPILGFIAEAVLQQLESLVFQRHRPKFWARYVDDTFVVIDRDQLLTFKEHLNAVISDIQFTMEKE